MRLNQTIGQVMTPSPHTISSGQNLKFALEMMKSLKIRHLPVFEAGALVGILTERDIHFIESFDKTAPKEIAVEDACSDEPFCVRESTPLHDVCQVMFEKKYGSALVNNKDEKLVGIFTWIDALKVLSTL